MENGLPRKLSKRPEKVKISDILNFTSAILAVVVSAIFYFAGWVYVSHWYSFFGIDATELNISPQIIFIHGVPGVFVIAILGLITVSIFAMSKLVSKKEAIVLEDVPTIVMSTYSTSIFALIILILLSHYAVHGNIFKQDLIQIILGLPIEVKVSFIGVIVSGIFFGFTNQTLLGAVSGAEFTLLQIGDNEISLSPRDYLRDYIWLRLLIERLFRGRFKEFLKTLFYLGDTSDRVSDLKQEYLDTLTRQQSTLREAATQTWHFWAGAFIILYFLVSIAVSSILGEWEARAGKKSMIGGWQAEATYIYSTKDDLPLPLDQYKSAAQNRNIYGPLMILGKNGDTYYLTDWAYDFPQALKPNIYVVKLSEGMMLGMELFAPTPTPTITPFGAQTPTSTPKPTITASPTP